jgi:hypothetical protein
MDNLDESESRINRIDFLLYRFPVSKMVTPKIQRQRTNLH